MINAYCGQAAKFAFDPLSLLPSLSICLVAEGRSFRCTHLMLNSVLLGSKAALSSSVMSLLASPWLTLTNRKLLAVSPAYSIFPQRFPLVTALIERFAILSFGTHSQAQARPDNHLP